MKFKDSYLINLLAIFIYFCTQLTPILCSKAQGLDEPTLIRPCNTTAQCDFQNVCTNNRCRYNDLFPFSVSDIIGFIIIFLSATCSSVAGIGGGPFFVPIMMIIFGMAIKQAIVISIIMMAVVLGYRYVLAVDMKNPKKPSQPLINYQITAFFCPPIFLGSIFGVFLQRFLPQVVIVIIFIILMAYLFKSTIGKGLQMYRAEKKQSESELTIEKKTTLKQVEFELQLFTPFHNEDSKLMAEPATPEQLEKQKRLDIVMQKETRRFPIGHLQIILFSAICVLVLTWVQSNDQINKLLGIQKCSFKYWMMQLLFAPIAAVLMYKQVKKNQLEYNIKKEGNYEFTPSDIEWTQDKITNFIVQGLLTGIMAPLLGVGISVIVQPLFLKLKLGPEETAYTASFLAFVTCALNFLQFLISTNILYDYAIAGSLLGLFGFYIGLNIVLPYLQRINRRSYITITLCVVMLLSSFVVGISGVRKLINDINSNVNVFQWGKIC